MHKPLNTYSDIWGFKYDLQNILGDDYDKLVNYATELPHWEDEDDGSGKMVTATGKTFGMYELNSDRFRVDTVGRNYKVYDSKDFDKPNWRSEVEGIYLNECLRNELVSSYLNDNGFDYPRGYTWNSDMPWGVTIPGNKDAKPKGVALDENIAVSVETFNDVKNQCREVEQAVFSDSILDKREVADMMLNAIKNAEKNSEKPHDYTINYENTDIKFSADSIINIKEEIERSGEVVKEGRLREFIKNRPEGPNTKRQAMVGQAFGDVFKADDSSLGHGDAGDSQFNSGE